MEYLDYFDSNMNFLGVGTREEVHKNGWWHKTFHGWVLREEDDKHYVVFQIRASERESYPDLLDITVAGHLLTSEKIEDGFREVFEEIGIRIEDKQKKFLGIRITIAESIYKQNKEFSYVYFIYNNTAISEYSLQEKEVKGIVEIEVESGLRLFSDEEKSISVRGYKYEKGKKIYGNFIIAKKDFVQRIDNYYYKIFIMADRFFSKCKYLTI